MKKYLLALIALVLSVSAFSITSFTLNMNYENTARDFLVHLPTGFTTAQHVPIVLNMHGLGSNGGQQEFYSRMSETSDANNFVVVYPNGIGNSWNSGFTAPYNSSPDDVGFLSKIIDTLALLYNIDLNRVYATGMSNGGFQSYRLACDLENRIAAIASVTGTISTLTAFNCTSQSRKVPVLHIHGTEDPLVPYGGDVGFKSVEETLSFWLGQDQCSAVSDTIALPNINLLDSSTVERIRYQSCGDGTEVWFYKITGGGHTWPNATFDYIYGPTNRDLDASQEIWNFFNRFTLNGPNRLEEVKEEDVVTVFPNPSNGKYEIRIGKYEMEQPMQVSVFDMSERNVLQQKVVSSSTEVNLCAMESGVYFLRVKGKDFFVTKKILKN
ncbi:MAG: T9SS type A sorting domain-containing protein [Bacteroidetes bacterium]|nr:T9SS type A sorting domain-containing protein [Bacteroidota bacterium]